MSANVLLNLLNELRKSDKMRGLPSILSLILSLLRKEFNKFHKTGTRTLYVRFYLSHDLILLKTAFLRGNVSILPFLQ